MKALIRILLFIAALAIGGWLGTIFLAEFEPLKMLVFFAVEIFTCFTKYYQSSFL